MRFHRILAGFVITLILCNVCLHCQNIILLLLSVVIIDINRFLMPPILMTLLFYFFFDRLCEFWQRTVKSWMGLFLFNIEKWLKSAELQVFKVWFLTYFIFIGRWHALLGVKVRHWWFDTFPVRLIVRSMVQILSKISVEVSQVLFCLVVIIFSLLRTVFHLPNEVLRSPFDLVNPSTASFLVRWDLLPL